VKLAIVCSRAPFAPSPVRDTAERLADALILAGHTAPRIELPFAAPHDAALLDAVVSAAMLRCGDADRAILLNFPAYYARHRERFVWLQSPPGTATGNPSIRQSIANLDARQLATAKLFAADRNVAQMLLQSGGLDAPLLARPADEDDEAWAAVAETLAS
jgi:hypothetical protein